MRYVEVEGLRLSKVGLARRTPPRASSWRSALAKAPAEIVRLSALAKAAA